MNEQAKQAIDSKTWPFIEAEKIYKRIGGKTPDKGYVLFETGYGPSGLPHIGTFGEVARTTMVRRAFEFIAPQIPTKLFCVSDDMDGLRKVPENLPNQEMIAANLGKPLTNIPDPFETHDSFGSHMNNRLCNFLDKFGFEYEFKSATQLYKSGIYDEKLLEVLKKFDAIMKVMLPTLGEERQKTYSPFMPISPATGNVLQVPTLECNPDKGTIKFKDEDGEIKEIAVTGGNCKLQWKPDFGMRWAALDVDFEMYGKDHNANARIYSDICNIVGGKAPEQFMFELFLDDKGEKISKSKGNGLSMEEWLRYAPTESLAYYMFQSPRKAKRLYFDVIPKAVDEYISFLVKFEEQSDEEKFKNPVWHIHNGNPPKPELPLTFALLLNLASACHAEDSSILWGFIETYAKGATPENSPYLDELVKHALHYYQDFVKPNKKYRKPNEQERAAMADLAKRLLDYTPSDEQPIGNIVFAVGKEHGFENLREWFQALYEVLLGQSQGPRFGSFIELYGKDKTAGLIQRVLRGEDLAA
ncbi:MAG: lysine--tRNA ligase [Rickettsiales bacterium]|nr:lysine--tRNA ligase [Pseudomonadota bacterium]MDA0966579.1 lysine--tRNA ligase [Pseudomonadota bacterium]MDG4543608.1 lysine--tRNA ligase [Rickettsiales bacterium]MDG4545755.1 lysine--tRNA ligase [Rickettsiales bacterium]MDG4547472.1 lysine--tRNA ligase [Rickettsiales bacterium]